MARGLRGAIRQGVAATMVTGLVTFGAVAFTAAPASAHSANVHGTAECVDGRYVVTWTITNNDKDHDAELSYKTWPEKSELKLDEDLPAGAKIVGFQTLPKGATGTAKIQVDGVWEGDGPSESPSVESSPSADSSPAAEAPKPEPVVKTEWVEVPLPAGPCGEEKPEKGKPAPEASVTLSCDDFRIVLSNEKGTRPAKFWIAVSNGDDRWIEEGPIYVPAGKKLVIPDDLGAEEAEDGEMGVEDFTDTELPESTVLKVAVKTGGKTLASAELDFLDCVDEGEESPSASPAGNGPGAEPSNAAEEGSLPVTGASLTGLIAAAVLVLGAGVGMVFFTRRRKQRHI